MNQPVHFVKTPLPSNLTQHMLEVEREIVLDALQAFNGAHFRAAHAMGLTRKQMHYLVKKHAIDVSELRVTGMVNVRPVARVYCIEDHPKVT